jgi:hypothetical protein
MTEPPLRLRAVDIEDVQVIAAVLQDAIAPVCDMAYDPAMKSFVMVVHRFRWDACGAAADCFERVRCALDVRGVEAAQLQGFDRGDHARMLDLLTVSLDNGCLRFIFAGGAQLKLALNGWQLRLEDFGEPWPTPRQPCHADAPPEVCATRVGRI